MTAFWPGLLLLLSGMASALETEWHGQLDLRWTHADSETGWLYGGLGKSRFDRDHDGLRLGQGVLNGRVSAGTLSARAWVNAYTDREQGVGLGEAFAEWRPVPSSAWQWRLKGGLYFPELSLENGGPGWTPDYLFSSSAINTWVGEELRALGTEVSLRFNGAQADSPHDWQLTAGVFTHNDPAGGLLAWRGWTVGDRVTAVDESVPYPDLPIFHPGGYWSWQAPSMEAFREIDDRAGFYASTEYRYLNRFRLTLMRYDNRGDPEAVASHQWAWDTTFNHVGAAWYGDDTTFLAQAMSGRTVMGYIPFHDLIADYDAWYLLLSRRWGDHRLSARYDWFEVEDRDGKAADPNGEYGHAWTVGWNWRFRPDMDTGVECLRQVSERESRLLLGLPEEETEDLWQARVRWWF